MTTEDGFTVCWIDPIDWRSLVVGDLVSVELRPASVFAFTDGAWDARRLVQGVYIGCGAKGQEMFLRIMGAGGLVTTVDAVHVHSIRVVAAVADCEG